ncbi:LppA family lipoprotein [Kibdelosporangium philippinense]|uniref:LppA family lipoprotein n=1 Tax=Kibdelosporangium philippinense TaxID=211113 RepID=A0ABS8ZUC9_9PSEU|nr:LppA family lipoprotein [Kibdelosporangium philippinense]MCE7011344.1 LppA family lipoprotein [Kibdelosporangium philippinense]
MTRLLAVLCTVLVVGACSGPSDQYSQLANRPDIEQIHEEYLGMLGNIRDELVAKIGITPWQPNDELFRASMCGEFNDIGADGEKRRYSSGHSPGNLPDARWGEAVKLVESIANQHGFKLHGAVIDRPGDHEVTFGNDWGAELLFGTAKNTTLSVSSGCHLTREAYQRGAPK